MIRTALIFSVVCLFIIAGVSAQDDTAPIGIDALCGESALALTTIEAPPEDEQTRAVDALLRQLVTQPSADQTPLSAFNPKPPAPGAVVLIDSPAGRYFRAIGAANIETCAPLTPTMPFAIGSNTKMMTAAIIFQLQEEGLLSVDDLVSDYLPDEIVLFAGAEAATIEMLLTHTAGLPDYLNSKNPTSIGVLDADPESGELETRFTPQELIANAAADEPILFEPGAVARWSYSNTGYIMLGLIIEQVTGQSYNDALTARIIEPLGLQNTVPIDEFPAAELGLPTSYLQSPFTYETSGWNYTQAWSAGNVVSTAEDMAVFLHALYSGALFDDPATLSAMLTPAAPGAPDFNDEFYYMHGGFYKHGFLGHGGQTLGFVSDVGYNPKFDIVIVMWSNSAEGLAGQGVYHVGHALGITPTFDEVLLNLIGGGSAEPNVPSAQSLSVDDVRGIPFTFDSLYDAVAGNIITAPEEGSYTVTFGEDGEMTIVADCNMVMASYSNGDEGALSIELGVSTRAACPEGSLADVVLEFLSGADMVIISESEGEITLSVSIVNGSSIYFTASR